MYHLLDDTSVAKSNSSSNITSELTQASAPMTAWPSFSDSQHLEKVSYQKLLTCIAINLVKLKY